MPGILPMKVIKVGNNAQTRIAQACDRCRSKKIRCDGIRPCCSQCSSVGFECKTSDKLSRRAFPRGYTESLEERVRALETEVRELKDLLDEKDEKIDMLSKLHSHSAASTSNHSSQRSSKSPPAASPAHLSSAQIRETPAKEYIFRVQQSPYLEGQGPMSYFTGTSSSRSFLDAFKQKAQQCGRDTSDIVADGLLTDNRPINVRDPLSEPVTWKAPPRLESDRLIAVFFQEWAPLFPVLHRPSFLELYQRYMQEPESITDNCSHALLNLVFGIAALSTGMRDTPDFLSMEAQWQAAIDSILTQHSMSTLQCLILAQIYCIQRGDYDRLLMYKALAVPLSSRLGLHQSQTRFALGTLTCETRKKAFWTLYTIDCFSSITLGLPKLLKDDDVHCEYPVDADEEYIEESGFKAPCPGEHTRLSSALALFRAARILSRVLEEVYPALPSYNLSLQKLASLSEELDEWQQSLAPHLRLPFAQDRPSTGTTSSRSPLLSLTYHFIRSLIHRPAVIAGLGSRASSSMLALSSSSKHIIQILALLNERGLAFTFCLNKDEVIVLSGLGLLYQSIDLDSSSKLYKDMQKVMAAASGMLETSKSSCAARFARITRAHLPLHAPASKQPHHSLSRHNSDGHLPSPDLFTISGPEQNKLQKAARRLGIPIDGRRATFPIIAMYSESAQAQSQPKLAATATPIQIARSEPARSPSSLFVAPEATRPSAPPAVSASVPTPHRKINLDYLSFSNAPTRLQTPDLIGDAGKAPGPAIKTEPTDWERLLGSIDGTHTNIFDNIYGGPAVEFLATLDQKQKANTSNPDIVESGSTESLPWGSPADLQWHMNTGADASQTGSFGEFKAQPESVFSISTDDGSGNSGEEMYPGVSDWPSVGSSNDAYPGIIMPHFGPSDDALLGGWEATAVM